MNDFTPDEHEALKQVAREKMAYNTLTNKIKQNWVWGVGAGVLGLWALWDRILPYLTGVK